MCEEKICGIYKIISPSGKIYIGESKDVCKRKSTYSLLRCSAQTKLYHSLKKHGWESHIFEVIEECEFDELKCRERYWQDYYDVLGENGLNCKLTSCGELKQQVSKETAMKISVANTGQLGKSGEDNPMFGKVGELNPMWGKEHSPETRELIRQANIE